MIFGFKTEESNLCDFFKFLSKETWQRIGFVRKRHTLKIFETTITQNILFSFAKYIEKYPKSGVKMYEATDEKTNGNDIELILKIEEGCVKIPLQAKILCKSNFYERLDHRNQINDLIKYAKSLNGIPLYLLYNYKDYGDDKYGCSLISAYFLKSKYFGQKITKKGKVTWKIPSFDDLHPNFAFPWHELFCNVENLNLDSLLKKINLENGDFKIRKEDIKIYQFDEIKNEEGWEVFSLYNQFSDVDSNRVSKKSDISYAPRFRILIDLTKNYG